MPTSKVRYIIVKQLKDSKKINTTEEIFFLLLEIFTVNYFLEIRGEWGGRDANASRGWKPGGRINMLLVVVVAVVGMLLFVVLSLVVVGMLLLLLFFIIVLVVDGMLFLFLTCWSKIYSLDSLAPRVQPARRLQISVLSFLPWCLHQHHCCHHHQHYCCHHRQHCRRHHRQHQL